MSTVRHNININHSASWKKNINDDLHAIWHKLDRLNTTGSGGITDPCCPATNALLDEIKTAINNLDISVDNLVLNTDTLEINTDELENLLTALNQLTLNENNENQVLLTDIKTNLQTLIDKLNEDCNGNPINVNICKLPIDLTYDTYQVKDCEGNDIGTPQNIQKTVVLNNTTTKICNVQELADAIITEDTELIYTCPTKFHIGTTNYYTREKIIFNSQTQTEISRVTEYSTDGVLFNLTVPIGTPIIDWYNSPIIEYNTEEEILLTPTNTYTININTVHSYAISVLGNGTASTIQIGTAIALPIKNGYHKQMEFTNLNTQEVIISCGIGDEIRIILTKI